MHSFKWSHIKDNVLDKIQEVSGASSSQVEADEAYILHKLVFNGEAKRLSSLLQELDSVDINQRDIHGES